MLRKPVSAKNLSVYLARWTALLVVLLSAALLALLTGCESVALSADILLNLQRGERWSIQAEVVYAQTQFQLLGSQIDQGLNQEIGRIRGSGVNAKLNKRTLRNGDVQYTIKGSGKGYQLLNAAFFDGQPAVTVHAGTDPQQVDFNFLPLGTFFGAALNRNFTLKGGEIHSSNGVQSSKNTVIWNNPVNVMQATLTPGLAISPAFILVGAGLIVGITLLILTVRRASRKVCPYCGTRLPRSAQYCGVCGNNLEVGYERW